MTYADYLGQHSYWHNLARNTLLGKFPRLPKGKSGEEYSKQIEELQQAVKAYNK